MSSNLRQRRPTDYEENDNTRKNKRENWSFEIPDESEEPLPIQSSFQSERKQTVSYSNIDYRSNDPPPSQNRSIVIYPSPSFSYSQILSTLNSWIYSLLQSFWSFTSTITHPSSSSNSSSSSFLSLIFSSISSASQSSGILSESQKIQLKNFSEQILQLKYDSNNQTHETMLYELWSLSFTEEKLKSRRSEQWKRLGFQGTDPATDWRGSGLFGLSNLLFFASSYPKQYQTMLRTQEEREKRVALSGYPFAIAGLNVIFFLYQWLSLALPSSSSSSQARLQRTEQCNHDALRNLLDLLFPPDLPIPVSMAPSINNPNDVEPFHQTYLPHSPSSPSLSYDNYSNPYPSRDPISPSLSSTSVSTLSVHSSTNRLSPNSSSSSPLFSLSLSLSPSVEYSVNVFHELFCLGFRILDDEWKLRDATYMSFPTILSSTKERLERLLASGDLSSLSLLVRRNRLCLLD